MRILEGQTVDLISPFPSTELKRVYGWVHCYRSIVETDLSPKTQEEFVEYMEGYVPNCISWGIIDKNHITNTKHEAPLIGIFMFEPTSPWTGYLHVATARKAWRTGLVDEAMDTIIKELFSNFESLTRIGAYMLEKNFPARSLAKRHGMEYEGIFRDVVVQNGEPASLVYFGLTRRNWLWQVSSQQPSASEEASLVDSVEQENKAQ